MWRKLANVHHQISSSNQQTPTSPENGQVPATPPNGQVNQVNRPAGPHQTLITYLAKIIDLQERNNNDQNLILKQLLVSQQDQTQLLSQLVNNQNQPNVTQQKIYQELDRRMDELVAKERSGKFFIFLNKIMIFLLTICNYLIILH